MQQCIASAEYVYISDSFDVSVFDSTASVARCKGNKISVGGVANVIDPFDPFVCKEDECNLF